MLFSSLHACRFNDIPSFVDTHCSLLPRRYLLDNQVSPPSVTKLAVGQPVTQTRGKATITTTPPPHTRVSLKIITG